eukprot:m.156830 g.156830  ORF g.156830 m.156830 type:complete len:742 (+) comp17950_c0_seq8:272-2497(+)
MMRIPRRALGPSVNIPVAFLAVLLVSGLFSVLKYRTKSGSPNLLAASSININRRDGGGEANLPPDFNWTIFITPQGFVGGPEHTQRRAIMSWLRLDPKPRVVLLGAGERYHEVADELGLEVDPRIDLNLVQMPLAGSVLHQAFNANTHVSVLMNSDILLTQSFVDAIAVANKEFSDWFLTGARLDLHELPSKHDPSKPEFSDAAFVSFARDRGRLHTAGGVDYFVWNNQLHAPRSKLIHGSMPPFIRGKSKFDNWFVHEVIQAGYRDTIDGTEAITAVHVDHNYKSAGNDATEVQVSHLKAGSTFWMTGKLKDWQIYHNLNLAVQRGSYRNQDGTSVHTQYKLANCLKGGRHEVCTIQRLRPGICPCEHHVFALETQNDPTVVEVMQRSQRSNIIKCGAISSDTNTYEIPTRTPSGRQPIYGLPFTLRDLLPIATKTNHVILTGVSYNYREVLMNFVCNIRRLGIYDSLIIAAWDEDMYRFGFQMGLPIFYFQTDVDVNHAADLAYGSKAFRKVTKLKSQVVLEILRMGYDVTWTDTDIAWLRNPIPILEAMASDFVVQSNAPSTEAVANGPLRINSGFYRIRSSPIAIAALEAIVVHAASSRLTEQPSFYMVLCGGKEGRLKEGDNACIYRPPPYVGDGEPPFDPDSSLRVEFLDRHQFPNGATGTRANVSKLYWDLKAAKHHPDNLVVLHNNWIKGLGNKVRRLVEQDLWYFDREAEICMYDAAPRVAFTWAEAYKDEQ